MRLQVSLAYALYVGLAQSNPVYDELTDEHRAVSTPWYEANHNNYKNEWGYDCDHSIPARVAIGTQASYHTYDINVQAQKGAYFTALSNLQADFKGRIEFALARIRPVATQMCFEYDYGKPGVTWRSLEEAAMIAHGGHFPEGIGSTVSAASELLTWMMGSEVWFPKDQTIDGVEPLKLAVLAAVHKDNESKNREPSFSQETGITCKRYWYQPWSFMGPSMSNDMAKNNIKGLVIPTDHQFEGLIEWWHWLVRSVHNLSDEQMRVVGIPKEYVNNGTYYERMVDIIKDQLCWMEYERTGIVGKSTPAPSLC